MAGFSDSERKETSEEEPEVSGELPDYRFSPVPYDPTAAPSFQVLDPEELRQSEEPGRVEPMPAGVARGENLALRAATSGEGRRLPRRRWGTTVREWAEVIFLAVLLFLGVRASLQNFRVEGASMVPSLEDGQYIIINKLAYAEIDLKLFDWVPFFEAGEDSKHHLFGGPGRGDVIVFRAPNIPERDFIKRIIGVPGDTVEINGDGLVYVNGRPLEEPYAKGKTVCSGGPSRCGPWEIPANNNDSIAACGSQACYFVLGDNRLNSSDSRSFGLVPKDNIIGKAFFSYWPLGDAGLAPNHSVSFASPAGSGE